MNNHRLLMGLFVFALMSGRVCAVGSTAEVMSLDRLFDIAESNSVHIRQTYTAEEEARNGISVSKSQWLPEVEVSLSLSYIGDGFTTRRDFSDYQNAPIPHFGSGMSFMVSQPLYTGGALTNSVKLAELKSTETRYAAESQRDNIRFKLVGQYLDIYKCHNLKEVVRGNIAQALKMLEQMTARYKQGVALQNDIIRYELLVSNLELQLTKIDNTLEILNRNLVVMAGLPEDLTILPDTTLLSRSLPLSDEDYWQMEASVNSPSLHIARNGVDISRKTESLIQSEFLPKIGLQAGWTMDGPILVEVPPINRNLSYWYVGLGLKYNLSSLYKSNKSMSRSQVATRLASEHLDAVKKDVALAVNADYVHYQEAYIELKTQQKRVELAERNYKTVSTRYSADMALITDLLDAVNSKLDAERQLVDSQINIIFYYYKLLYLTGTI